MLPPSVAFPLKRERRREGGEEMDREIQKERESKRFGEEGKIDRGTVCAGERQGGMDGWREREILSKDERGRK